MKLDRVNNRKGDVDILCQKNLVKENLAKDLSTGTTLGALALIISIGALGLGLYQFFVPAPGPQIYILEHEDIIWLERYTSIDYLNELNITYNTEVGDRVVLEFSCRLYLDPVGTTTLTVNFDNNGTLYPSSNIYVRSDSVVMTSGYMSYTFEASTAGENYLVIWTSCDDETDNYIIDCILTVTVYG